MEIILGCLYGHWWGVAVASVALGGSIWMVWKHPKALEAGWGRIAAVVYGIYTHPPITSHFKTHPARAFSGSWSFGLWCRLLLYVVALLLVRVASMRGALEIAKDPATMRADVFPHGCETSKVTPSFPCHHSTWVPQIYLPSHCRASHPFQPHLQLQGCARVAESTSYPDPSIPAPEYAVYMHHALGAVEQWIGQQRGVAVIVKRVEDGASIVGAGKSHCSVFLHLRAMSLFMGFIDDMYIQMECLPRSVVQFSVQSQLRIGIVRTNEKTTVPFFNLFIFSPILSFVVNLLQSDLGVNEARIKRFLRFVAAKLALVGNGDCTKNMDVVAT